MQLDDIDLIDASRFSGGYPHEGWSCLRREAPVCLFYPSANRDEEVFESPSEFRIDRNANPHLGCGVGEHFCLGSHLARLEIRVFLEEFVARLVHAELAGGIERPSSSFVGGVKHLPMRARLAA